MRRIAAFLIFLAAVCISAASGYTVPDYHVDMTLDKDGTLHVSEKMTVIFSEPRHGIYRGIQFVYDTGKGVARNVDISGISVGDGRGGSLKHSITRSDGSLLIKIGDKDSYMPVGQPVTIVLGYDVFGEMNWQDNAATWQPAAELYWNIVGSDFEEPLEKVSFAVHFPSVQSDKDVRVRLYTGPYGSGSYQELDGAHPMATDARNGSYLTLTRDLVEGGMTRQVDAGEPASIVLDIPADAISKPSSARMATMFLRANLGFIIPVVVFPFLLFFWAKYGKDPARAPIAVQFEPPDSISGPEAGTLLDQRVDIRDIAAGIFGLAVKGYLVIHPSQDNDPDKATLTLTGTGKEPLTPYEQLFLRKLQNCDQVIDKSQLRIHVSPHVPQLTQELYGSLVSRGYYMRDPNKVRNAWMVGGIAAVIGLAILCGTIDPMQNPLPPIVGGVIGALIVMIFARIMPRRTYMGAIAFRKCAGFEEFIRRAHGKEVEWMAKKPLTPELFEDYLPHAIAFGLAAEWASAFVDILKEMPSWYASPYGTAFQPIYFSNSLGSIGNSLGSAAGTPPRSSGASGGGSGFGGGGFSGGGFGGGSMGSW